MQPIQIVLNDAPEHIHIPDSLQHHKIEVTFKLLDSKESSNLPKKNTDINSLCGILKAPHTITLEQMDNAIKKRGGKL